MNQPNISIPAQDLQKLLAAACPEAALLYLYFASGRPQSDAMNQLHFTPKQMDYASASLRQLGLYPEPQAKIIERTEAPVYSELDVTRELSSNAEFPAIVGEAQRRLGRMLSTEELKILLCIYRYLGLPGDVISILINACIESNRARGVSRLPSLRMIEKEAYRWADNGIDTIESAAAYMQRQLNRQSGVSRIRHLLQLDERKLTAAEEKFVCTWLEWGFADDAISLAYEKTCMNTGGLKWPYMNSILKSWHEKGLLTVAQISDGDRAPAAPQSKARTYQKHDGELSDFAKRAVARMMANPVQEED